MNASKKKMIARLRGNDIGVVTQIPWWRKIQILRGRLVLFLLSACFFRSIGCLLRRRNPWRLGGRRRWLCRQSWGAIFETMGVRSAVTFQLMVQIQKHLIFLMSLITPALI